MLPKRKRKNKHTTNSNAYLDVKQEYLATGTTPSLPLPPPTADSSSSSDEAVSEVRLRASEKRDVLLYYILENFYTIDEAHKNSLYAFMLKLSDSKVILTHHLPKNSTPITSVHITLISLYITH